MNDKDITEKFVTVRLEIYLEEPVAMKALDDLEIEMINLYNRLEAANAVVDKLDKTADGVYITPGMIVYHPDHLCNRTLYSQLFISFPRKAHSGDHDFIALIQDCYSTWELAEAAANIKKEGKE